MNKIKIDLDSDLILRSENIEYEDDTLKNTLDVIVASGSNGNGSYTKFRDGTMICRKTIEINAVYTLWANSIYSYDYSNFEAFPIAFAEKPTISAVISGSSAAFIISVEFDKNGTNVISIARPNKYDSKFFVDIIAIGRWK